MQPKTRLDPVVRLREQDEDEARRALAAQLQQLRALRDAEARAHAATRLDGRQSAAAAQWDLVDQAHVRALAAAEQARAEVRAAEERERQVRAAHHQAHARAEAVRRVAEARREELRTEWSRREARALDDIAVAAFAHRAMGVPSYG